MMDLSGLKLSLAKSTSFDGVPEKRIAQ